MTEPEPPPFEDLSRLSGEVFDDVPGDLRDRLRRQTALMVGRRRLRRRLVAAAALVLAYAAGAATTAALLETEPPRSDPPVRVAATPTVDATEVESPVTSDPASLLRDLAEAAPRDRRDRLRRAGDAYLAADRADPAAALTCYRRLLEEEEEEEEEEGHGTGVREASPQDSWLLIHLKLDAP